MKVSEVIEKALRKELKWIDAAAILGISERQVRRWRFRYVHDGIKGLTDGRVGQQPYNRISDGTVTQVLELYKTSYRDFNAKHFWEQLVDEHGIAVSYSWTKRLLHAAGYLRRSPRRNPYRRRRERRPLPGMLVHLDGSKHRWFEHPDGGMQDLLVMLDDATGEILDGSFVPEEGTRTVLPLLKRIVSEYGTFGALYVDRASHFVHTPTAGGDVDYSQKTQIARVLDDLGIELICAYSPQARGRSERMWRTLQGRLPQELRRAAIVDYDAATAYLRSRFRARFNRRFGVAAAEQGTAFVPLVGADLERIFTLRYQRVANSDHTIRFCNRILQLPKSPGLRLTRRTIELRITLDGEIQAYLGARRLQTFPPQRGETTEELAEAA